MQWSRFPVLVESAAHLIDHVFPEAPVRQWVLTFPFPLRFLLAAHPEALSQVLAVIQCFGSAPSLNVHLRL